MNDNLKHFIDGFDSALELLLIFHQENVPAWAIMDKLHPLLLTPHIKQNLEQIMMLLKQKDIKHE